MTTPDSLPSKLESDLLEELRNLERIEDLDPTILTQLLFSFLAEEIGDLEVSQTRLENLYILNFVVGENNKAKIIGKKGHILKAVCSICKAYFKTRGKDVVINVKD